jgi:hypothetical protein
MRSHRAACSTALEAESNCHLLLIARCAQVSQRAHRLLNSTLPEILAVASGIGLTDHGPPS